MTIKQTIAQHRINLLRYKISRIAKKADVDLIDWKSLAESHAEQINELIMERQRERVRAVPLWTWLEEHGFTQKSSPAIVALNALKHLQDALHVVHGELAESNEAREQLATDLDAAQEREAFRMWTAPVKIDLGELSDEARALLDSRRAFYRAQENPVLVRVAPTSAASASHSEKRGSAPSMFRFPENGGPQ